MRVLVLTGVLALAGALVTGCSSPSPKTTPSRTATPVTSSSASPSAGAASKDAASLDIVGTDLPSSSPGPFTQLSDGLLAGHTSTDQRTFGNADGSVAIECDVILEQSHDTISGDYNQARAAARSRVATLTVSGSPSIGEHADEFVGTTSDGKGIVAITFTRFLTVDAVLVETPGAPPSGFPEQVASALDARIQNAG